MPNQHQMSTLNKERREEKMQKLAILIAKSGVALLDLLPREWEVVVADYSRLDQRQGERLVGELEKFYKVKLVRGRDL